MTSPLPTLQAQPRETRGKDVRFLRRQGWTPANLYGRGLQSQALQVLTKELEHALSSRGRTALLTLSVNGTVHRALLRALQRHPTARTILHADFYRVEMDRPIETTVPILLVGEAPASRLPDVFISHVLHSLQIACLPADIPAAILVDLSSLVELDTAITVRDLAVPPGVTVLTDPDQSVVRAARARVAEAAPTPEAPAEAAAPAEEGEAEE